MEGHLGDLAEPQPGHDVVTQDEPCDASELLRWPWHPATGLGRRRRNEPGRERPRDSDDDPDLATDVRLLHDDVA
jgi:hypothetical protein